MKESIRIHEWSFPQRPIRRHKCSDYLMMRMNLFGGQLSMAQISPYYCTYHNYKHIGIEIQRHFVISLTCSG